MRNTRYVFQGWEDENFIFNLEERILVTVAWTGKKYSIIHAWVDKTDKLMFDVLSERELVKTFPWTIYKRDWRTVVSICAPHGDLLHLTKYLTPQKVFANGNET